MAYLIASRIVTISEKNVTPSMRPAATIIAPRMSPAALGCRAMPSIADAARRPMPAAPPMIVRPAPMPAAKYARALGSMGFFPPVTLSLVRGMRVHPDEDGGEQREDVGLDQRHQQLEQHDEQ